MFIQFHPTLGRYLKARQSSAKKEVTDIFNGWVLDVGCFIFLALELWPAFNLMWQEVWMMLIANRKERWSIKIWTCKLPVRVYLHQWESPVKINEPEAVLNLSRYMLEDQWDSSFSSWNSGLFFAVKVFAHRSNSQDAQVSSGTASLKRSENAPGNLSHNWNKGCFFLWIHNQARSRE